MLWFLQARSVISSGNQFNYDFMHILFEDEILLHFIGSSAIPIRDVRRILVSSPRYQSHTIQFIPAMLSSSNASDFLRRRPALLSYKERYIFGDLPRCNQIAPIKPLCAPAMTACNQSIHRFHSLSLLPIPYRSDDPYPTAPLQEI